ncbi:MAG: arginine--tRNA ligase [Acidimicrobiales bacterium]|jgi:arginyl-tRNA synthetase
MTTEQRLAGAIVAALGTLHIPIDAQLVQLVRPARPEHGDWSTNVALVVAKAAGRAPRDLAGELAKALKVAAIDDVLEVEVAGPGFINFKLAPSWLHQALRDVVAAGEDGYATCDLGHGERVQIEFVSANPTGPLHVGNGWLGSYGDALGRVMSRCGFQVRREYYVNDTGGQIRLLGNSLLARRRGEVVPEEGYQGEYVTHLAGDYDGPDDVVEAGRFAADRILENIKATLDRLNICFDEWQSQASIEDTGQVGQTIELFRERGLVYEDDGALWLRSTEVGDTRDRVLIRTNGDATYLAGDLAYHRDKFLVRGFDRVIDVFGADHHGQVASLKAGVAALGVEPDRLEIRLGQLVNVVGRRMSKRAGNVIQLDSVIDEFGPDATRLLSLLNSIDQATTLDLDLMKRQSMENPVFYVQYAHARISSIDRKRVERGIDRVPISQADLALLVHDRELELIRCLVDLPRTVAEAAKDRAPHKVTSWVRQLAGEFHGFYHDCRVLSEEIPPELTQARLWLVDGVRIGLAIALGLLGVQAPDEM